MPSGHSPNTNHQNAMSLHTDMDSPEVHLPLKTGGLPEGIRLNVKKGDPDRVRKSFSYELERLGCGSRGDATRYPYPWHDPERHSQVVHYSREKGRMPKIEQANVCEGL